MNKHLRLVIGGHDMATDDLSIEYEQVNPLFNDNVESGSLPFTLSLDGNRVELKNMEDINSDVKARDLEHKDCQVYADGVLIHSGELIVGEEQELVDQLEVSVNSYVRSLSELISDMNCQDVPIKDDIQIGECVGDVTPDYDFTSDVWITTDMEYHVTGVSLYNGGHSENNGENVQLPSVGFSLPRVYREGNTIIDVAKDGNNNKIVDADFINTSEPYPIKPYCNGRICYAHKKMNDDGTTSDEIDASDPFFTLEANRPASGICFYLLYFLDCLFGKKCLDLNYDNANLLTVEDMKRLAFYTTHCEYDIVRKHGSSSGYDLNSIDQINQWLENRDDGGDLKTGRIVSSEPETYTDWSKNKNPKKLQSITVINDVGPYSGTVTTIHVGETYDVTHTGVWGTVEEIKTMTTACSGTTRANIMKMMANSKNFPDTSVSSIVDSLWALFGIKFVFDAEQRKVTPYFIRDVLRNQDSPRILKGQIISINKVTEKTTGFRMRYAAESDPQDQSKNVRDGVRDYATAYDYLMSASPIDATKDYAQILTTSGVSNTTCYVDRSTGYAYRWKVDGDASDMNDLNARLFEVAGYKGVEIGDCSKRNEDYIVDVTSSLEPVILTDTNFRNAQNGSGKPDSLLVPFADADMSNENEFCKITYALGTSLVDFPMTVEIRTKENFDPSQTDDGDSPLQTYDWGTSVAVMRGGGSDATIQYYDYNYDGFGNAKYRTVSGTYAMTSDSIDQWNNDYDYNASGSGIGDGERFSLKICAYHTDPNTGEILCDEDETDPQTGEITRKVRSRGLFDTFMSELAHFVLERNVYRITMLCEAAELADIPNHWDARYQIGDLVGWINKFKTQITDEEGLKEVVIDFYSL